MRKTTVVLCLVMMTAPAWAGELTPAENEYIMQRGIESEYSPAGGHKIKGGRAPTQTQMELYVPLTDEQQELPTMDVYPSVLPPIRPYNPPGLAVYDETPMVTNPGVLPPLRPVYPTQ